MILAFFADVWQRKREIQREIKMCGGGVWDWWSVNGTVCDVWRSNTNIVQTGNFIAPQRVSFVGQFSFVPLEKSVNVLVQTLASALLSYGHGADVNYSGPEPRRLKLLLGSWETAHLLSSTWTNFLLSLVSDRLWISYAKSLLRPYTGLNDNRQWLSVFHIHLWNEISTVDDWTVINYVSQFIEA